MRIVEWRPTVVLRDETTPTDQALAVIDDTCREAFERYDEFLRVQHLPRLHAQPGVLPAISLLPGNTLLDGKTPRALNDMPSRFESVAPAAATGACTSTRSITSFCATTRSSEGAAACSSPTRASCAR